MEQVLLHFLNCLQYLILGLILQLPEVLGLLYTTTAELNSIIDSTLPKQPTFTRHKVVVTGEFFELYSCNIIDCLKALRADPEFLPYLVFELEQHYPDEDHKVWMYHDMHTGDLWWSMQVCLLLCTTQTMVLI